MILALSHSAQHALPIARCSTSVAQKDTKGNHRNHESQKAAGTSFHKVSISFHKVSMFQHVPTKTDVQKCCGSNRPRPQERKGRRLSLNSIWKHLKLSSDGVSVSKAGGGSFYWGWENNKKRLDLSYHKSWYDIWYLHLFSLPVFHVFRLDIAWLISLELKEFWAILFLIFLTWCDVVIWTFCRIAWFLFLMMGAQNHWELRRRFWLCLKTFGNKSGACAWKVPDMKDMDAAVAELGTLQQACNALASESTSHCVFQICQEFERTANAWSLRFNAGRFATM